MLYKYRHISTIAAAAVAAVVIFFPVSEKGSPALTAQGLETAAPFAGPAAMWEQFENEKRTAAQSALSDQF